MIQPKRSGSIHVALVLNDIHLCDISFYDIHLCDISFKLHTSLIQYYCLMAI